MPRLKKKEPDFIKVGRFIRGYLALMSRSKV